VSAQVHAIDHDGGYYGEVRYWILPGLDQELFAINTKTGDVIARKRFDYENTTERKVINKLFR
jgi:hypothetical protein